MLFPPRPEKVCRGFPEPRQKPLCQVSLAQHPGKFLRPSLEQHLRAALITGRELESAQMSLTTLGFVLEPTKAARVVRAAPRHSPGSGGGGG